MNTPSPEQTHGADGLDTQRSRALSHARHFIAIAFLIAVAVGAWAQMWPWVQAKLFASMSVLAYVVCDIDAGAARRSSRRLRPYFVLILDVLGGWPGVLLSRNPPVPSPLPHALMWLARISVALVILWMGRLGA